MAQMNLKDYKRAVRRVQDNQGHGSWEGMTTYIIPDREEGTIETLSCDVNNWLVLDRESLSIGPSIKRSRAQIKKIIADYYYGALDEREHLEVKKHDAAR